MKILVLILASDNTSYYRNFQLCWKRYMNLYPNIDCYFYKGNQYISTPFYYNNNDNEIIIKLSVSRCIQLYFNSLPSSSIIYIKYFLPGSPETIFLVFNISN
jgi:hypothetical protein